MKYIVVMGRVLYSLIFLMTVKTHFAKPAVDYATAAGVPLASWLVPISGVLAITGGLSIALGYKAKTGAGLIILFLIPVTLFMHAFWNATDAMQMHMQMGNFFKNTSLLGAALLIAYFGLGSLSLDAIMAPKVKVKGFTVEEKSTVKESDIQVKTT